MSGASAPVGPASPAPEVFAVILNYRAPAAAIRCAESVLASEDVAVDLLLVDNDSGDGSAERLVERFGPERVLAKGENDGYAGGMNVGLRRWLEGSAAPFALVATMDVSLHPAALASLVGALRADPAAAIAGPTVWLHGAERVFSAGGVFDSRHALTRMLRRPERSEPHAVDWIDGCCMLLRRQAVESIGTFDPRFFMYYEEADLCWRARESGSRVVVVPGARVWQEKPDLPGPHYFYYMSRNRYLFWGKNFGVPGWKVAGFTLRDTIRMMAWAGVSLLAPPLWKDAGRRFGWLRRQLGGSTRGTLAHVRGQYGP